MACWIHKWETIHREEPLPGFWFEDRKCCKCGEQEIERHHPFFSSISDCAKLGAYIGVYKAFGNGRLEKLIDEELNRQLAAKGLMMQCGRKNNG